MRAVRSFALNDDSISKQKGKDNVVRIVCATMTPLAMRAGRFHETSLCKRKSRPNSVEITRKYIILIAKAI